MPDDVNVNAVAPVATQWSVPPELLRTWPAAANEAGRHSIQGVQFESTAAHVRSAATDGRAAVIVQAAPPANAGHGKVIVPVEVVRRAAKLLPEPKVDRDGKAKSTPPSPAVLAQSAEGKWSLTVVDGAGTTTFHFNPVEGEFPDLSAVIPDFGESKGNRAIGLGFKVFGDSVQTLRAVLPKADAFALYLPSGSRCPVGLQATHGRLVAFAIVMPAWVDLEQLIKGTGAHDSEAADRVAAEQKAKAAEAERAKRAELSASILAATAAGGLDRIAVYRLESFANEITAAAKT